MKSDLLTRKEVEHLFHISTSTVIRWEARGTIKRVRIRGSRKALYRREDLERLIFDDHSQPQKTAERETRKTNDRPRVMTKSNVSRGDDGWDELEKIGREIVRRVKPGTDFQVILREGRR